MVYYTSFLKYFKILILNNNKIISTIQTGKYRGIKTYHQLQVIKFVNFNTMNAIVNNFKKNSTPPVEKYPFAICGASFLKNFNAALFKFF